MSEITLVFDVETSNLAFSENVPVERHSAVIQLAFQLYEGEKRRREFVTLIKPEFFNSMSPKAYEAHKITVEECKQFGMNLKEALIFFYRSLQIVDTIVSHNIQFDVPAIISSFRRVGADDNTINLIKSKNLFCTMQNSTNIVKSPWSDGRPHYGREWKWPKLEECTQYFFGELVEGAHDALVDVRACAKIYFKLKEITS